MANPTYQAQGDLVRGAAGITVAWPLHEVDDIAILFVESANEAVTLSTPAGFVAVTNQGTGTGGAAAATRLTAFWCRATTTSMASPVVADSGTRQSGIILTFRGCIASGDPWDVFTGNVAAAPTTAVSMPGPTTTVVETLIVNAFSNSLGIDDETVRPASLANASVTNLTKRLNTQLDGVGGGTPTSDALPVGLMSFGGGGDFGDVGEGPGLDAADPRCTVAMFVPNRNTIGAAIDTADQHSILLVLNVAGNKGAYTSTVGGNQVLDMGKYEANVRAYRPDADNTAFADRAKFEAAVASRRIVFYVVDEPNLTSSLPISPTQVNQMALIHKAVWPGCITIVRVAANTLNGGWNAQSRPTGGYTGVDYCWVQYNNNHGKGNSGTVQPWVTPDDPRDVWQEQLDVIATNNMQMGLCVSLNVWAGGIGVDTLGVSAAWDTNDSGGGTPGYTLGDRDAGPTEVLSLVNANKSVIANPDWIRKFAELAAADEDIPFLLYWQHATSTNPSQEFLSIYQRADFEEAFDDAITTGLGRTSWNGWRTAK